VPAGDTAAGGVSETLGWYLSTPPAHILKQTSPSREARTRVAGAIVHKPLPLSERRTQLHEGNTPSAQLVFDVASEIAAIRTGRVK
jgi:hypothetical protein